MKIIKLVGVLRIYSLADLILLLLAAGATGVKLVGAICLWIGFLAYLESAHAHDYRINIPKSLACAIFPLGLLLFPIIEGAIFIASSMLYAKKNRHFWGLASPIFRGLQTVVLIAALTGLRDGLPWLAGILIMVRNLLGDLRDVEEDRRQGMITWPIKFLLPQQRYLHLLMVLGTTALWWLFLELSIFWLASLWLAEVGTYFLTPRSSNHWGFKK